MADEPLPATLALPSDDDSDDEGQQGATPPPAPEDLPVPETLLLLDDDDDNDSSATDEEGAVSGAEATATATALAAKGQQPGLKSRGGYIDGQTNTQTHANTQADATQRLSPSLLDSSDDEIQGNASGKEADDITGADVDQSAATPEPPEHGGEPNSAITADTVVEKDALTAHTPTAECDITASPPPSLASDARQATETSPKMSRHLPHVDIAISTASVAVASFSSEEATQPADVSTPSGSSSHPQAHTPQHPPTSSPLSKRPVMAATRTAVVHGIELQSVAVESQPLTSTQKAEGAAAATKTGFIGSPPLLPSPSGSPDLLSGSSRADHEDRSGSPVSTLCHAPVPSSDHGHPHADSHADPPGAAVAADDDDDLDPTLPYDATPDKAVSAAASKSLTLNKSSKPVGAGGDNTDNNDDDDDDEVEPTLPIDATPDQKPSKTRVPTATHTVASDGDDSSDCEPTLPINATPDQAATSVSGKHSARKRSIGTKPHPFPSLDQPLDAANAERAAEASEGAGEDEEPTLPIDSLPAVVPARPAAVHAQYLHDESDDEADEPTLPIDAEAPSVGDKHTSAVLASAGSDDCEEPTLPISDATLAVSPRDRSAGAEPVKPDGSVNGDKASDAAEAPKLRRVAAEPTEDEETLPADTPNMAAAAVPKLRRVASRTKRAHGNGGADMTDDEDAPTLPVNDEATPAFVSASEAPPMLRRATASTVPATLGSEQSRAVGSSAVDTKPVAQSKWPKPEQDAATDTESERDEPEDDAPMNHPPIQALPAKLSPQKSLTSLSRAQDLAVTATHCKARPLPSTDDLDLDDDLDTTQVSASVLKLQRFGSQASHPDADKTSSQASQPDADKTSSQANNADSPQQQAEPSSHPAEAKQPNPDRPAEHSPPKSPSKASADPAARNGARKLPAFLAKRLEEMEAKKAKEAESSASPKRTGSKKRQAKTSSADKSAKRRKKDKADEAEDDDEDDLVSAYEEMTVAQLRAELRHRGLATTGTKAVLIERLEEDQETLESEQWGSDVGGDTIDDIALEETFSREDEDEEGERPPPEPLSASDISSMTVRELRDALEARDLSKLGRKAELVERLKAACAAENELEVQGTKTKDDVTANAAELKSEDSAPAHLGRRTRTGLRRIDTGPDDDTDASMATPSLSEGRRSSTNVTTRPSSAGISGRASESLASGAIAADSSANTISQSEDVETAKQTSSTRVESEDTTAAMSSNTDTFARIAPSKRPSFASSHDRNDALDCTEPLDSRSMTPSRTKRRKTTKLKTSSLSDDDVRIVFTGIEDAQAEKTLKSLGAQIVDDVSACTHLYTDKVRRTPKFLEAVCRGRHIVGERWLQVCEQLGRLADPTKYPLASDGSSSNGSRRKRGASTSSSSWGSSSGQLNVAEASARARSSPLLQDITLSFHATVNDSTRQGLSGAISAAGARLVKSPTSANIIVVADPKTSPRVKASQRVLTKDDLVQALLYQSPL